MEALRDTLLRRLGNVNGNLVRSDSDASSGSGGGSSDDTKPAKHGFMAIPIMFATNRKMVGGTRVGHVYGTSRGDKLAFGCMWVSVPDLLMYGSEDTTTWRWSRNRHGAPRNKLVKLSTVTLQEETCFHKLQQAMRAMQEKEAIVFVHGYNTSLSNATHRMAQVVYTANFRGTALVFSWPSNQSMAAYTADEANAMWAISDFVHVLKTLLTKMGMDKVHVLAHSMGSRVAIYALLRLIHRTELESAASIGRLVLAAPDFDMGEFMTIAPDLAQSVERITLYCNSEDQALHLSRSLHGGYPRLGDFRGFLEMNDRKHSSIVGELLDAIDTTGTDSSWLRHAYIFTACGIILDACVVLRQGVPPAQRSRLKLMRLPSGQAYWTFQVSPSGKMRGSTAYRLASESVSRKRHIAGLRKSDSMLLRVGKGLATLRLSSTKGNNVYVAKDSVDEDTLETPTSYQAIVDGQERTSKVFDEMKAEVGSLHTTVNSRYLDIEFTRNASKRFAEDFGAGTGSGNGADAEDLMVEDEPPSEVGGNDVAWPGHGAARAAAAVVKPPMSVTEELVMGGTLVP
eukprot:SM000015S01247  [mRNA]  locus=s15:864079:867726:+ [translate_table: standard]